MQAYSISYYILARWVGGGILKYISRGRGEAELHLPPGSIYPIDDTLGKPMCYILLQKMQREEANSVCLLIVDYYVPPFE